MTNPQSERLDLESTADFDAINDELYERGMTDVLPVVPPTKQRVDKMLEGTELSRSERLAEIPPRYGTATVETVAINAVMAGCNLAYISVLIAAVKAMAEDQFNLYGINATTRPVVPLVVVNGPIIDELDLNYGYNVFEQGWRSDATIGRAVRLLLVNVGGSVPGDMDRATHGHPGKYSFCIAENESRSPWDPFHVARGYDEDKSVVTVLGADGPHEIDDHVSDEGEGILGVTADVLTTTDNNNAYYTQCELTVVFSPEHADTLATDGWTREEIKWYLYDQARNSMAALRRGGMYGIHDWPRRFNLKNDDAKIPLVEAPDRINILVAGGAGKHSMGIHSFGETRSISKRIDSSMVDS